MNFRLTNLKVGVALVISFIVGAYAFIIEPGIVLDAKTSFMEMILNKSVFFIFWFVPLFILIYFIWSLFEKK